MTGTKMRPFGETIPIERARELIGQNVRPITRTESVPLEQAAGRVLATEILAHADVPPFSRAGMDGYAVRADDTRGATRTAPRTLTSLGKAFTGDPASLTVTAGTCVEIATGAPMPEGADAVVMVEDTHRDGAVVSIFAAVAPAQHVGRQGADISQGQRVLAGGDLLNASRVGALAALGFATVDVFERPRVTILSTGNEIIEPGTPLGPGQIYDINRFTISALIADNGGVPVPRHVARDTLEDLERAVDEASGDDMIVFSGGSSVGERDLILDVMRQRGTLVFHGLAVKPGKPTAFGLIGSVPFFGLPGYPTSCLSNGYILVAPALRQLARLGPARRGSLRLPLGKAVVSPLGRHQFFSVRIENGIVMPAFKGSGDITSMSQADGYIEIPIDVDRLEAGTLVEVSLFA